MGRNHPRGGRDQDQRHRQQADRRGVRAGRGPAHRGIGLRRRGDSLLPMRDHQGDRRGNPRDAARTAELAADLLSRISLLVTCAALAPAGAAFSQGLPPGLTEREVTVPGPVPLPGTLTLPAGKGPFPALIIVNGSGAGDRDLTMGPQPPLSLIKPYRDLAWGLAQQGVAVLRYDKRTRVAPMWYMGKTFTVWDETVQDALAALTLLRQQPEVNAARTYLIGH